MDSLESASYSFVALFNLLLLLAVSVYFLAGKSWEPADDIVQGEGVQPYDEQPVTPGAPRSQGEGSRSGQASDRPHAREDRVSSESSVLISKFGLRKPGGPRLARQADVLANSSNLYEALIDNSQGSEQEESK